MEYLLVPSQSKNETAFLIEMFKKMNKQAATLSSDIIEDVAFVNFLKKAEATSKGSLSKVKAHLSKVSNS